MGNALTIGTLLESENGAPARLLASKLNRHTFWCGQSGSGKTYALGVALEQIMLHTELPLVIMGSLMIAAPALLPETRPPAAWARLIACKAGVSRSFWMSALTISDWSPPVK